MYTIKYTTNTYKLPAQFCFNKFYLFIYLVHYLAMPTYNAKKKCTTVFEMNELDATYVCWHLPFFFFFSFFNFHNFRSERGSILQNYSRDSISENMPLLWEIKHKTLLHLPSTVTEDEVGWWWVRCYIAQEVYSVPWLKDCRRMLSNLDSTCAFGQWSPQISP